MAVKKYKYDNGLPFKKEIEKELISGEKRVKRRKATLYIIDGAIGEGKSTLGVHIVNFYNKRNGKGKIDYKCQYAMGGSDFQKKLLLCIENKYPVMIYDESGDFSKKSALARSNQQLNRTFEQFRGLQIIIILLLPFFDNLDNTLFNNRIPKGLFHIKKRSMFSSIVTGYSPIRLGWLKYHSEKLPSGLKYLCFSKVRPNFYSRSLDLPPAQNQELDKISSKGKIKSIKRTQIKSENLVSGQEARELLGGVSDRTFCRYKLLHKIKPKQNIGRTFFYDKKIVERIKESLKR